MEIYKLFNESKNLSEVLMKMNLSDNVKNWNKVKEMAINVGFDINVYKERRKRYCLKCGKELKKGQKKFCSNSCSATFNNKGRLLTEDTKNKIRNSLYKTITPKQKVEPIKKHKISIKKYCLNCGDEINHGKFCSSKCSCQLKHKESYKYFLNNPSYFNNGGYTPKSFRDFFLIEQDNKCSICNCEPFWNGKYLQFVIDHIDGDASNNTRDNIRMICPNCDSQTDTFKSKNKNSTRRNYWKDKIIPNIENGE